MYSVHTLTGKDICFFVVFFCFFVFVVFCFFLSIPHIFVKATNIITETPTCAALQVCFKLALLGSRPCTLQSLVNSEGDHPKSRIISDPIFKDRARLTYMFV
jgi:predicted PurR-regulated permease PerM